MDTIEMDGIQLLDNLTYGMDNMTELDYENNTISCRNKVCYLYSFWTAELFGRLNLLNFQLSLSAI